MYIEQFIEYLKTEKKMAPNSLDAYGRDIRDFESFVLSRGTGNVLEATSTDVVAYLNKLKAAGRSPSTVNRKLASIRAFYNYLLDEKLVTESPARGIKTPRIEKKELEYLSIKEIAFFCGFNDLPHFRRQFFRRYSVTPGEYRRVHRVGKVNTMNL